MDQHGFLNEAAPFLQSNAFLLVWRMLILWLLKTMFYYNGLDCNSLCNDFSFLYYLMQSICLWTDVNAFLMAEKYQYNNKLRLGFISLAVMAFYCISNVNVWLVKYFVVSTGSLYLLNVYQYIWILTVSVTTEVHFSTGKLYRYNLNFIEN